VVAPSITTVTVSPETPVPPMVGVASLVELATAHHETVLRAMRAAGVILEDQAA